MATLGILAFFSGQKPATFLRGVGDEGDAQIRVECCYGVVEQKVGVAQQIVLAFLGAVTVEAEVGIHLVGFSGHDSCDAVPADVPKFVDGFIADILVDGGLGDRDEIVYGVVRNVKNSHIFILKYNSQDCQNMTFIFPKQQPTSP